MSDTLLPCPFCGADPNDEGCWPALRDRTVWTIRCPSIGCVAELTLTGKEATIKAWNRRMGYVPMTDDEMTEVIAEWYEKDTTTLSLMQYVEQAVIKRAGLHNNETAYNWSQEKISEMMANDDGSDLGADSQ